MITTSGQLSCEARWKTGMIVSVLVLAAGIAHGQEKESTWRSKLYPKNWTPALTDSEGRFLPDMSYAGYHNGETEPSARSAKIFNVVKMFGADSTGKRDATRAIQKAVDAATGAGGGVVLLPRGLFRCDGVIQINASKIVLRGAGKNATRLFFTTVPRKGWQSHISFRGRLHAGKDISLSKDGDNRSFDVRVDKVGNLKVGDDVALGWVITDAFVDDHGMVGIWKAFNGKWRPFFLRRITRIDRHGQSHRITLDVPLRYRARMRDDASLRRLSGYISECGIESLSVANALAPKQAWSRAGVHVIGLDAAKDCWVRDVATFPSPLKEANKFHLQNGGIIATNSKRITIANCRMEKAQNRGGGGAGYLFEVSRSNEILTRDCVGLDGRHNFIQNWDFGTAGCVWLRCVSRGSRTYVGILDPIGWPAYCEYHHSLAMACLVDQCELDDGWSGVNRRHWSSGAGNTVTQSTYWNTSGKGEIRSWQYGMGYIIGTTDIKVRTALKGPYAEHTSPEDMTEGLGKGRHLVPQSLYEDQLRRRCDLRNPVSLLPTSNIVTSCTKLNDQRARANRGQAASRSWLAALPFSVANFKDR